MLHLALAAFATLVATAFALSTLERYLARRRRHELAWTVSLTMFALGSLSLLVGAAAGWDELTFRSFYFFGAVANVPFLALGTLYLLGDRRTVDRWATGVTLATAFAAGVIAVAPLTGPVGGDELPRGSEVFGALPRILAAVASGVGATVVFVGAVWSAVRLLQGRQRSAAAATPSVRPGRLAAANLVIALGTALLSASGLLNSVLGEMDAFAVTLAVGIAVIFAGFLLTFSGPPRRLIGRPLVLDELVPTRTGTEAIPDDDAPHDDGARQGAATPS